MKRFTTSKTEAPAVSFPRRLAPVRGRFFLAVVLLALSRLTPLAFAGFDEGLAAYDAGNFTLAHEEFLKAAEQGHAEAQGALRAMYAEGQGVPRNYIDAYMWFSFAAARELARNWRPRQPARPSPSPEVLPSVRQSAGSP